MNEPIRHHYIPQFILRNFSDDNTKVNYYDIKTSEFSKIDIREVFMEKNLYRDETNNPDNPTKLEKDFSKYEQEISHLIKEKFLYNRDISISIKEYESLLLYLAIQGFRNANVNKSTFDDNLKNDFYQLYQPNGKLGDMWKRNLEHLVNCRSIKEVIDNKNIDEPIKSFMLRDTVGLYGTYLTVVESRGSDFIISDTYPLQITGSSDFGELPMMAFYPISPERMIIVANNGVLCAPNDVVVINKELLQKGKIVNGSARIPFNKMYKHDVDFVNNEMFKWTREGIVIQDINKTNLPIT